ncbi:o-succinylbenzoate synthase [Halococcus saccharolyticus]|uniref:o-succinylbenzoate synthase n=1 Tax=Halococcus saccharolyticus DSM 5350 TaxID=1227455 RepID=M0MP03_9EURY|nr:o-succinylbenzoate synthase [Halococcus saccharolyticus]EMA47386.1 chloromuconate cycloisomerase [Halococcus saccharolyticus DSM 5350]
MRIERFSLALATPLATARGTIDAREGFLVFVDVDGIRGVGEATPLPGWTESIDECRDALGRARRAVATDGWDAALATLDDGAPAARHGLALALCDARSRAAGVPLYRHLGGEHTERVPVNATVGDGTVEETADEAARAVEQGFSTLKVKVGAREVAEDVARLDAVRNAVGDETELRADANGAWSREEAGMALDTFADLDVAFVEQPLAPDDLAGHATLRGGAVGIALDESFAEHAVETVLTADVADVLVVKPMVLGGPDRAREAALRAREAGLDAVVTTTIDGALARTGAVHVAASLSDPPACGLATADRLAEDLVSDPAPVMDGEVCVPQDPGSAPEPPNREVR